MRAGLILAAVALARIGFGYQYQTVATLGPDLMERFQLDYAGLGTLIGAFMLLGGFLALPLGLLARRIGDRLVLGCGLLLMVLGPAVSALAAGPTGIGVGRSLAGAGAVAMIVLQNKVIADWFAGRSFMWAISVSVAAYPIGVGLAQLILPPLALAYGWQAAILSDAAPMVVALVLFLGSFRPSPYAAPTPSRFSLPGGRECLLLTIGGLIWTAYTAGYSGYTGYVPSLMAARGESLVLTGLVLTIATWGNVPATMAGAGLAERFGAFRIFLTGHGGSGGRHDRCRAARLAGDLCRGGGDRRLVPPRRDHGGGHAVGTAGEPRGRHGVVLFDLLRRRRGRSRTVRPGGRSVGRRGGCAACRGHSVGAGVADVLAAPAIGGARAHACEGVSDAADETRNLTATNVSDISYARQGGQLTRSQQVGAQTSEM